MIKSEFLHKLYLKLVDIMSIYITHCVQMLLARGYLKNEKKEEEEEEEDCLYFTNDGKNVIIFFCQLPKLNINRMKEYISFLDNKNIFHAIVVYEDNITPSAKKIVDNLYNKKIEMFCKDELMYNITEHRFYRPHIKVSKEETRIIKKKMGGDFPVLLKTDVISRYFDFQPGDFIKVIRKDGFICYREVKD